MHRASQLLGTAVDTLQAPTPTRESVLAGRVQAVSAVDLLTAESKKVVPAHFAAAQAGYGVRLLDDALANGATPTPAQLSEAIDRLRQARGVLPA